MAKKNGAFAFIVRGLVIFGFLFCEREMYKDFEKVKQTVDSRKQALYDEITGTFVRREEKFYLDKAYLKADYEFKERKRIEAEEKRKAEIERILEYRRQQAEKLQKEQELKNQELNKEDLNNNLNTNKEEINKEQVNKEEIKKVETKKQETKEQELKKKEEKREEKKQESKPPKKVIPRGGVNVRNTKPTRIEDVTQVPKEVRPIKIHRVETNVYHLSDDDDKKKTQKKEEKIQQNKIQQNEIKKEKSSTFKEIKILEN